MVFDDRSTATKTATATLHAGGDGSWCTCDRDGTPTTQNSLLEKTFVKVGRFAFSVAGAKPALACRF
jgi:hypothetical protein